MKVDFNKWLIELRRDFHTYPELGFEEFRTSEKIAFILEELKLQVERNVGRTGVVGLFGKKSSGKKQWTIALRGDMDALPIQQTNNVPYKSRNDGVMHACGHDAHMTIMLGVARWLSENVNQADLSGQVKFIFQPAEECCGGACCMIDDGVLNNPTPDVIYAAHVNPELEAGRVGIYTGPCAAGSDYFQIILRGEGGHGARPHFTQDIIVAASQLVLSIQTIISRSIPAHDPVVISICKFIAGNKENIIPEEVVLEGTIRSYNIESRNLAVKRLKELTESLETAYQIKTKFIFEESCPPCICHPAAMNLMKSACLDVLNKKNVLNLEPSMGSEDFSRFLNKIPGGIIRLGSGNTPNGIPVILHNGYFDIDERCLQVGVKVFSQLVLKFFDRQE